MSSVSVVSIRRQGGIIPFERAIRVAAAIDAGLRRVRFEDSFYRVYIQTALEADTFGEEPFVFESRRASVVCQHCGARHDVTVIHAVHSRFLAGTLAHVRALPGYATAAVGCIRARDGGPDASA